MMKGVLFTAGLLLVGIAVLSLSFILYQQSSSEITTASRLIVFGRMNDEVSSISNGFRDIVGAVVNVTVNGDAVSFREAFPNPDIASFSSNMGGWKVFCEESSGFNLNLNISDAKSSLPMIIQPDGATYTHPDGFGGNTIKVTRASNVSRYVLDLILPSSNPATLNWNTINTGSDVTFTIYVHASNEVSDTRQLNALQVSTLSISFGSNTITVQVGSPSDKGMLQVSNPNAVASSLATDITMKTSDMLTISLPEQSINIQERQYNISKISAIRIA